MEKHELTTKSPHKLVPEQSFRGSRLFVPCQEQTSDRENVKT